MLGRLSRTAIRFPLLVGAAWKAWVSLEPKDWSVVASEIGNIARLFPKSPAILRLHARVLRAARRLGEAVLANEAALALSPDDRRILLELGRAHRHAGQRERAIESFVAAAKLGSSAAAQELCRYGARARLPERMDEVFSRTDYDAFTRLNPVFTPPPVAPTACFRISLSGSSRAAADTMASLDAQTYSRWFVADDAASTSDAPSRIYDVALPPGAVLDPNCLAWLNWAIAETGCAIVRADHDQLSAGEPERCDPVFLPQPDLLWTEGSDGIARLIATGEGMEGPTAHVPLVLMTVPVEAEIRSAQKLPDGPPLPLSVIIPTRDNPVLLEAAIESLLARATRPDLIEVIIVDNNSQTAAARQMFTQLSRRKRIAVTPFPEPFNWSRANNVGASAASGEALLFLNDDTEMLTDGWDRILAGLLANPSVGLVGARMVYPDGSIQHGGFVFGMDNGPQHEGRWMAGNDAGPGGRWTAVRQAAAVTGAFIAIRKSDFDLLGGFDETFAVDFADVDFCLRTRARGQAVAYCGAITLLHHESVSRGLNLSREKKRRFKREQADLRRRWKGAIDFDPGYHPAWARVGCSYDGLQPVSREQIAKHVFASVSPRPWKAEPSV